MDRFPLLRAFFSAQLPERKRYCVCVTNQLGDAKVVAIHPSIGGARRTASQYAEPTTIRTHHGRVFLHDLATSWPLAEKGEVNA